MILIIEGARVQADNGYTKHRNRRSSTRKADAMFDQLSPIAIRAEHQIALTEARHVMAHLSPESGKVRIIWTRVAEFVGNQRLALSMRFYRPTRPVQSAHSSY